MIKVLRDILKPDYDAHELLVAHARSRAQLWRLLAGVSLVITAQWFLVSLIWTTLFQLLSDDAYRALYYDFDELLLPQSALVMLYSFAPVWLSVVFVSVLLHNRGLASLTGPMDLLASQAIRAARWLIGLNALGLALVMMTPGTPVAGLALGRWLSFLIPALIGIAIQIGAEELMFRGYLQQQLAARFRHPVIWMLIPSVLFGVLHYQPAVFAENAWLIVAWATLFGLLAADLTARAGTLGPAMALHFVTNTIALLLVAPQGPLSGLALFQHGFSSADVAVVRAYLPVDLALMICSWLAVRISLRR
ncbi:MAG: CPBP family intramembrane glutamic endopeptidase [Pseudomonadota bacterium]